VKSLDEPWEQNNTMKKTLLTAIVCATTATSAVFAQQHQQSVSFTGPSVWTPGTSVTLSVFLTVNYNAIGYSYFFEVPNAIAPFLTLTGETYFGPFDGQPWVGSVPFNVTTRPGYMAENRDLGAGTQHGEVLPPGTTHIADVTLTLNTGAPLGTFTMYTTSTNPLPSIVTDTDFNDNAINPPGQFVFNVVPEPSTLALFGIGAVGSGLLIYRRRKHRNGATDQCGECPDHSGHAQWRVRFD